MRASTQRSKAQRLGELHREGDMLVLLNAWDGMSARVFEDCGFPAIATTSAGIAYAFGYPDGERLGRDEMAEATGRIAGAVSISVTADVEAVYGNTPEEVAETAQAVIEAGADCVFVPGMRDALALLGEETRVDALLVERLDQLPLHLATMADASR